MQEQLISGPQLSRGVSRHLRDRGFACLEEFVPVRGLRVDVAAVSSKGEIWIAECKSSRIDYVTDNKWQGYLDYCDRYFFAISTSFPSEILPKNTGLILTDSYDAEITRFGSKLQLSAARRKKLLIRFAQTAANRLFLAKENLSPNLHA